jgi:hypothetical protein
MIMTTTIIAPVFIHQVIPYSLLEQGKRPTLRNSSIEQFLDLTTEALTKSRPDNISMVIAIPPGKQTTPEMWGRRSKPDAITLYTFFDKNYGFNTFSAIKSLSKILAPVYRQTKILALIDPYPIQDLENYQYLDDDFRGNLTGGGCEVYAAK